MNKTAKEMFEELGYELIQDDMNWVVYTIHKEKWFQFEISFFKQDKSVHLNTRETTFGHSFDMQELQAINKQVEERGKINEKFNHIKRKPSKWKIHLG